MFEPDPKPLADINLFICCNGINPTFANKSLFRHRLIVRICSVRRAGEVSTGCQNGLILFTCAETSCPKGQVSLVGDGIGTNEVRKTQISWFSFKGPGELLQGSPRTLGYESLVGQIESNHMGA